MSAQAMSKMKIAETSLIALMTSASKLTFLIFGGHKEQQSFSRVNNK